MKIICYYNKNLKMSEGKLAAQVGHVCKQVGRHKEKYYYNKDEEDTIIVLGLRQNKFNQTLKECEKELDFYFVQKDLGLTEVEKDTITAFAYINQNEN